MTRTIPENPTKAEIAEVEALITRLNESPVQSHDLASSKHATYTREVIAGMFSGEGGSWAQQCSTLPHLNRPDSAEYLRSVEHLLHEQVSITARMFDDWWRVGEHPAPHYPTRICIILRRAKHRELERAFLAAWYRHFTDSPNLGDHQLAERARKMGIKVRAWKRPRSTP